MEKWLLYVKGTWEQLSTIDAAKLIIAGYSYGYIPSYPTQL